jgi:predicted RNA-binding protein with PUA-like domain
MTQYWLMKTEPDSFSIADLERVGVEPWSGVRNRMARNFMRKMQVGDRVLFYHSSTEPPGVAGLADVERTGVIDETQFDPKSPYFDPDAKRDKPEWDCVDVKYVSKLPHYVSLARIRADPELANLMLLKWLRLSVMPVSEDEYKRILALGDIDAPEPEKPKRKPKPKAKPKKPKKPKKRAKKR